MEVNDETGGWDGPDARQRANRSYVASPAHEARDRPAHRGDRSRSRSRVRGRGERTHRVPGGGDLPPADGHEGVRQDHEPSPGLQLERGEAAAVAQWNQTDKTLQTKIVYWGPALCGKTTNLQQIHAFTDPADENRLISLNTASDRTLFFDLLPLDLGKIFGHTLKIQVYTVPGQVRYDATRRIVLSGTDAVVFVADSQRGRGAENRAAWENLRTNLKTIGL